jgi:hypothetical protein
MAPLCASAAFVVTFKRGKATYKREFAEMPAWQQLCIAVEEAFPEFVTEDFALRDGDIPLDKDTWQQHAQGSKALTLQVESVACKMLAATLTQGCFEWFSALCS